MHGGTQTPPPSGRQAEQTPVQIEAPHIGATFARSRTGCDMSIDTPRGRGVVAAADDGESCEEKQSAYQSYLRVTGAKDGVSSKLARSISTRFLPAALAR